MGKNTKDAECGACNLKAVDCPGHFGFMELNVPIFHLGFFRHVILALNCLCKVIITLKLIF
jgi:DNA-directed RNA polymerase III subunit RPC1